LASVRLRKNTLGVYRLDHDPGQRYDQAVAITLGTSLLMEDGSSAASWIPWAREKAIAAGAVIDGEQDQGNAAARPAALPLPRRRPEPEPVPVLIGVIVDHAAARKAARDTAFRATPEAAM
jgi:hypothetical protein